MNRISRLALAVVVCAAGAFAQGVAGLGAVSGTVRDASGAVVPDTSVVLTNESKGIRRTMQTTEAGVFAAPALVPASGYSLTITKQGFANFEAKDFQVQVGQTVDFRVTMELSTATTR